MAGYSELLVRYQEQIQGSDRLPPDLEPSVLGLAGEVGSILAAAKKLVREGSAYASFDRDLQEEFGDTLWYMAAICRRIRLPLEGLVPERARREVVGRHEALLALHGACATVVANPHSSPALGQFGDKLISAILAFGFSVDSVVAANVDKVSGAFLPLDLKLLPEFDRDCEDDEQLPNEFRVHVVQRPSGKAHMSLNGVFVGDPLLDNVGQSDGYRFHDVFHLANAAVLHWSPVTRALLKRKRKSKPEVDNTQDSGRAIVVEEGLTAWLFQRAGALDYFENADSVPYGILKTIQDFVAPYEVSECPPSAWERAILQGYRAFRQLRVQERGFLVGNRLDRTIEFSGE